MKTKIKHFFKTFFYQIGVFFLVASMSSLVFAYWNSRVSSGDTLTASRWNSLVSKVEQIEKTANNAENLARNSSSSNFFGYHKNNGCRWGYTFVKILGNGKGLCVQRDENSAKSYQDAFDYCASQNARIIDQPEYRKVCLSRSVSAMKGNWEWASSMPSAGSLSSNTNSGALVAGVSDCYSFDTVYNYDHNGSSYPFRCVY
jgi:hypothetical protein